MRLALAQLDIEPNQPATNRQRAVAAIQDAAAKGADLVALPEIFTVGYFSFDAYADAAEALDGPTTTLLSEQASEHDIAVLAGTFVEDLAASATRGFETPAPEGYANTAVFLDRGGNRQAVYRKHHLFGYDSAETELLTPGETLPTVLFEGFTIGITTCYDLRFPELYRHLQEQGTTLILVPSAWPYPRVEHWKVLTQARAIENLSYVGAVNGAGSFADATLLGRSAIYDPWGTKLAGAGDDSALIVADVDPAVVSGVREEFPALSDKRDLYH